MVTVSQHAPGMPCWVDLTVTTPEQFAAVRALGSDLFGWTWEGDRYAIAHSDGRAVFGLSVNPAAVASLLVSYFSTPDARDSVDAALLLGATTVQGPDAVEGVGTFALVRDTCGVTFGLWQPDGFQGFGAQYEPNAFGWLDHASSDPERAAAFYAELLGHRVIEPSPGMRILSHDEQWLASVSLPAPQETDGWHPIYVVDALPRAREVAVRHGATIVIEEMDVPGSKISSFTEASTGTLWTVMEAGAGNG